MAWPPRIGEPLPRAEAAVGIQRKLMTYSLAPDHPVGGPKARGFAQILGITNAHVDYLADRIRLGVLTLPVSAIRDKAPHGYICEVMVPVMGRGERRQQRATLTTAWQLAAADAVPRLVSAYIKDYPR